jgi:hypothetical protein
MVEIVELDVNCISMISNRMFIDRIILFHLFIYIWTYKTTYMRNLVFVRKAFALSLVLAIFTLSSCKKDEEPEPTPQPDPVLPQPWDQTFSLSSSEYFKATMNGSIVQKGGDGSAGWMVSLGTNSPSHVTYSGILSDSEGEYLASVSIGRLIIPQGGYPTDNITRSYTKKGTYTYGIPDLPSTSTFNSEVQYKDPAGVYWSTSFGSGAQTGSSFMITDTLHTAMADGSKAVKFKATFNCTLYNMAASASMSVTNGSFVGYFSDYE